MIHALRDIVLVVLACTALISCNPREDGCLEVEAVNFDFTADQNDPDLCTYPTLFLEVTYRWGDTTYVPGQIYLNDLGQEIVIESFYVVLSTFKLTDDQAIAFSVNDELEWCDTIVPDDIVLVDRSRFSFPIGEIDRSGVLIGANFTTGIPDTLEPPCLDMIADNHVLNSGIYDSTALAFHTAQFVLSRDSLATVLDTFTVVSMDQDFSFAFDKTLVQGRNDTIGVIFDLSKVFQATDINASNAIVVQQIADQLVALIADNN